MRRIYEIKEGQKFWKKSATKIFEILTELE